MQTKNGLTDGQLISSSTIVVPPASGITKEFHSFVADVEDLVKATTSMSGEDLEHARAKLVQRVADAKANLEKVGATISDRAQRSATATNGYVHQQPWQAIGIGASVGMLIGFLIARRSS
ncbi:DUF883 family protein [Sinimarinibacterium sp. CAU 1509]|uniref:DUF883 family protein n=1 Tax=Sinimarinibacterium sp. CAU 1509 TaxID=2562283 RepID=UPI00146AD479|nr:DUF883 family protein [Sinimarinibacterium sp. CAU 1509]